MQADVLSGGFVNAPVDSAQCFRAIMNAMARPGLIANVTGATPPAPLSPAAGALVLTLCDPDTGIYLAGQTDTKAVRDWITFHTGAPIVGAEACDFAVGGWAALAPLDAYRIGTPEYPDRSATLIVEMESLGTGSTLRGPGIKDTASLNLPEEPAFQANAARFPLGWDAYFCADHQLAALPRSTKIGD
ncbi:MAG: phosphonate C-P lyase system protein PhnH [Pelagimonas sp.]|jgi:alpha-D-ribose 1-methylphosphonate 5-triphosphate synthase subunit PhnH|nr:phosphonate C-P lyase system protein PhnH [Pelagimonas sp.]